MAGNAARDSQTVMHMLVNPITVVLNGCRHRKGTQLMLKKFLCIQNQEKHLVLVKQYKSNKNLDPSFLSQA